LLALAEKVGHLCWTYGGTPGVFWPAPRGLGGLDHPTKHQFLCFFDPPKKVGEGFQGVPPPNKKTTVFPFKTGDLPPSDFVPSWKKLLDTLSFFHTQGKLWGLFLGLFWVHPVFSKELPLLPPWVVSLYITGGVSLLGVRL